MGASSSAALVHDDDVHITAPGAVLAKQMQAHNEPRSDNSGQTLTPHHTPFHENQSLYTTTPLSNHAVGSQLGWAVPLWYNPVPIAGRYYPPPPHPPLASFGYGSVIPNMAYPGERLCAVAESPMPTLEADFENAEIGMHSHLRASKKKPSVEPDISHHREPSAQKLVSSSTLQRCPSSNTMGDFVDETDSESEMCREANRKQLVATEITDAFAQNNLCSNLMAKNYLSFNAEQKLIGSAPSTPCSERALPSTSETVRMQRGTDLEAQGPHEFPGAHTHSYHQLQNDEELRLQTQASCRNISSPGSSKPLKSLRDVHRLPRRVLKTSSDLNKLQASWKLASENLQHVRPTFGFYSSHAKEYYLLNAKANMFRL
jgi:hypothetical protein